MKKGFSLMRLFAFVMTVLSVTVAYASSDGFYWFKTEAVAITTAPVVRRDTKDIFDHLQGCRIAAPRRGVNIIGGKKVVL